SFADSHGVKLKASHAHELVAAYVGYQSRAAMLADTRYPVSNLDKAGVLVLMDTAFIEQRRRCLQDLPSGLPDNQELGVQVYSSLLSQGLLSSNPWPTYAYLAQKIADDYLLRQGHLVFGQLIDEPVVIRTKDVFGRGPLAEGIREEILDDGVNI